MEPTPEDYRQHLLSRFAGQPLELRRALSAGPAERLHRPLEPGGWSAHQVLAHVRDAEVQAFAARLHRLLEEDDPYLESFDPEAWMEAHYDPHQPVDSMLAEIERARADLQPRLSSLPAAGWNRSGRHPERGRRTLQWWVEYAVAHVQEHLAQLGA